MSKASNIPLEINLDGIEYRDLFEVDGLERLDGLFLERLQAFDVKLHQQLLAYRKQSVQLAPVKVSELLLAVAPVAEAFIAELFGIEQELAASREQTRVHDVVMAFKKTFVLREARRYRKDMGPSFAERDAWLDEALERVDPRCEDRELAIARFGMDLLQNKEANGEAIEHLVQWCVLAMTTPDGQAAVKDWTSFKLPQRLDYGRLVSLEKMEGDPLGRHRGDPSRLRRRDGFKLTDGRMSPREVQGEVHYCVYCHDHDGDFCAKGFPAKKGEPERGLKINPLGETLTGCPLEEKISEMHALKRDGHTLAALIMAMADNPMVPATGHRICNDCMKGCIYQKQDPVNIPQIETGVLTDVLGLPWGVEIYDLLTRWNPLRQHQSRPKPYNGRKVLIAGMGPAGFTMAHHLSLEGCAVVGIDGLKIEPLPRKLLESPVRDYADIVESLDQRVLAGFGGVAEYGITVRWDKNFLKLIYLSLARRSTFQLFGGVRLGGTLRLDDAWALGFDHVCIATGTGLPRVIPMGNSLARGMRQANDFLMALQLTGAAKAESLATLQVRLPAVVIGGGLTAIDTATEVQAYYIAQVEKSLARYEKLLEAYGRERVHQQLGEEDEVILAEFLEHGRAVRAERERAVAANEKPDFISLIQAWGGVTIAYRRGLNESPAYLRNHEEVIKALEEGIYYAEGLDPRHARLDRFGHIESLLFRRMKSEKGRWLATGKEVRLPVRSVFVAAGAFPNTIYEGEYPGTFQLERNHFLPHVTHHRSLQPVRVAENCKAPEFGPFTSYEKNKHHVSFIGDTHPVFHGSVVKAIASAKSSYPDVMAALDELPPADADLLAYAAFRHQMTDLLTPRVAEVRRDVPGIVELWVRAPMAARNFQPGQFFRLQTYESTSPMVDHTRMQIPLLTVSGAGIKADKIRLMVLQGASIPQLTQTLRPGDALVLMGPTGAPTANELADSETVLVIAGLWGAAVMLALGPALRAQGKRVLYFAMLGMADEVYGQDELEAAADQIVWCTASGPKMRPRRSQDLSVAGADVIEVLKSYGEARPESAGPTARIPLQAVDGMLVMGATGLLRALREALKNELQPYFPANMPVMGTVGSPMQCMLKGVCAQCLQWQVDPDTGERTRAVFSCAMQDQPLFWIDLDNLAARQSQNRLADHLTGLWLDYLEFTRYTSRGLK